MCKQFKIIASRLDAKFVNFNYSQKHLANFLKNASTHPELK